MTTKTMTTKTMTKEAVMGEDTRQKGRSLEVELDISAPVERVWAALTEAAELTRWFPMEAEVKPGPGGSMVGGSIAMGWGGSDECQDSGTIELWEPNERLVLVREAPSEAGPVRVAMDFKLAGKSGGETTLRLVHSGFPGTADWDHLYDGTRRGWAFELRGLRHYLTRHDGADRRVVWVKRKPEGTLADIWGRLMRAEGMLAQGSVDGLCEGEAFSIKTATGLAMSGTVFISNPPLDFAGIVSELNDAYLRVRIDTAYDGTDASELNLWLSLYGVDEGRAKEVERLLEGVV